MKTLLLAGLIASAPIAAFAMGCSGGHKDITMTCADGTSWDADSKSCMPMTTS